MNKLTKEQRNHLIYKFHTKVIEANANTANRMGIKEEITCIAKETVSVSLSISGIHMHTKYEGVKLSKEYKRLEKKWREYQQIVEHNDALKSAFKEALLFRDSGKELLELFVEFTKQIK